MLLLRSIPTLRVCEAKEPVKSCMRSRVGRRGGKGNRQMSAKLRPLWMQNDYTVVEEGRNGQRGRRTKAGIGDLWPKEKQRKGKVPEELQLASPSLLLPKMWPLNSHFSHTILPRRFPWPQKQQQLENVNTTAREGFPFRVTTTHFRPFRPPPRPFHTWEAAGGIKRELEGGAVPIARPSGSAIGCAVLGLRPTGLRLRDGQGGESYLMVGGSRPRFSSAGGRVR